jgi:hypothetical protein
MLHTNVMQFSGVVPVERQKFGFLIFSIFGQALSKNDINRNSPLLEKIKLLIFQPINIKNE